MEGQSQVRHSRVERFREISKERMGEKATDLLPPRIRRLRARFFEYKPSISTHRARATTQAYRENEGLPVVLKRAHAFYKACETIPIYIAENEWIVGHPGGKPRAGIFCPEIAWRWLRDELETIATRPQDPYEIDKSDKKELKEEIFPFWEGKSVEESNYRCIEDLGLLPLTFASGVIDVELKAMNGPGEFSPGYGNILLKKGFNGIQKEARSRLEELDPANPEDLDRIYFLRAVIIVGEGIVLLAKRYSTLAKELGQVEKNNIRKKELEKIAEICEWVPGNPPRSFHEALQTIWLTQSALFLEENAPSYSPGRVDQYLYPYYKTDVDAGELTPEQVEELLYCLFIKMCEVPWILSENSSKYFAGYMPFQNLSVGGQTPTGEDGTNDISYMVLHCVKNLRMYQPSLSVRLHPEAPEEFFLKVCEVAREGVGFPAIHFDDTSIKMMLSKGATLPDARDYCLVGCVEPNIHGKMHQWSDSGHINLPMAVEFALTNGVQRISGKKLGIESGDPNHLSSYEDFEEAVKKQLAYIIRCTAIASIIAEKGHAMYLPKSLASCLVEGCVESGKDIMAGGARYNAGPALILVGTADIGNSMAAVRKLVFEDKTIPMQRLCAALENDFVGYEDIYRACLNAPKYGNDDDSVDRITARMMDYAIREVTKYRGLTANLIAGLYPVSSHVPHGLVLGALPSGRKARAPIADGCSPQQGTDKKGPTAVIRSVDKINHEDATAGTLLNMKFDPSVLAGETGLFNLSALLKTHMQLGGYHVQLNCISADTLREAQRNPDQYKWLMVRVAGYSAYFVELCREIQNEIISRTTFFRI
ncbi:MAG: glycyl radical protein [Deltaproteobacteria bacterium]|nr:glycyl radical protein [Deltaproteobacteria bacterium]